MLTRRAAVGRLMKACGTLALSPSLKVLSETRSTNLLKRSQAAAVEIPADFTGLGYEMSSVATPDLLSPANERYVELVRGLGAKGILRLGGIVANYTRYIPNGPAMFDRQNTVITRVAIEGFTEFLKKTGWSAIWSVNFAQGTISDAVEEARVVSSVLGPRLAALEIGNEVDTYGRGQPFRPSSYDYGAFRKEYGEWHSAIAKELPGIRFAAPDSAHTVEWLERMSEDAGGGVQLLTTHYYRNGQTRGTAEQLLTPDPRLLDTMTRLRAASQKSGIPWRICEINSFFGGGRPGVSDTFVGALWTLNTMLLLAQYGCSGVNMETGVNQLGFVSSYSPIQDEGNGMNSAGVPYYGMLAFATAFAGCHQLFPLETEGQAESLRTYALGANGEPRSAVIVNLDMSMDAEVSIAGLGMKRARVLRLLAPSAESKSGVTLGGAQVGSDGRWRATSNEFVHGGEIAVPHLSAALVISMRG